MTTLSRGGKEMGVPPNWEIPEEIKARLSNQLGRQRAMVADGHIVMVIMVWKNWARQ
jgi:hypothetical protein